MNYGHGYSNRRSAGKYNAKKTKVDGIVFDSLKEANRYKELRLLQRAGEIAGLEMQYKFEIIPEHREADTIGPRGGRKKGKIIEPARYYVADFYYMNCETGEWIVEDVKGFKTPEYKLKKALMYDRYRIRIRET